MKKLVFPTVVLIVLLAGTASARISFKSPGPGMHFTAGLPVIVWADMIPRDDGHPGWPQVECRWDDKLVGERVKGQNKGYDYFPFFVPAELVTPGAHKITLSGFALGGGAAQDAAMSVQVDPWPADKKVIEVKDDLTVTDLDWTNVAIKGNGHTVKVSGKLTIKNSLITGLGSSEIGDASTIDPRSVKMIAGITGTLTGNVDIEDSTFEATGAVNLTINGSGDVMIRNNEFRANNFVKFVPNDPEASPVIRLSGNNARQKFFQANRIGAGITAFDGMSNWLIGGETDAQSNIMIGPRCVLSLVNCRSMHVIGNYMHHNYKGEWSQGFCLYCLGSSDILAEHNVVRDGSWPLQGFTGEFRYNMVVEAGHNWVRTIGSNTKFHHNLLVTAGGGDINSGLWIYKDGTKDVAIYNNTFDGGAPTSTTFFAPIIELSATCNLSTLRNNVFTGDRKLSARFHNAIISRTTTENDNGTRITYADYNCFFNPEAPTAANYDPGINANQGAGAHDVTTDPKFTQRIIRYGINEDDVWNRKFKVSEVLTTYRAGYTPAVGSPLLGAGDPADGKNSYIGCVGPGTDPADLFGRFPVTTDAKSPK